MRPRAIAIASFKAAANLRRDTSMMRREHAAFIPRRYARCSLSSPSTIAITSYLAGGKSCAHSESMTRGVKVPDCRSRGSPTALVSFVQIGRTRTVRGCVHLILRSRTSRVNASRQRVNRGIHNGKRGMRGEEPIDPAPSPQHETTPPKAFSNSLSPVQDPAADTRRCAGCEQVSRAPFDGQWILYVFHHVDSNDQVEDIRQ